MSSVLIVHPDAAFGAKIATAVARAGHDVRVVLSGERAMDRFIQAPADVVVLDQSLEGQGGASTAEAIRWMPGGRRAQIVFLASAGADRAAIEERGRSIEAYATLIAPDETAIADVVARATKPSAHEAQTRVLSAEQVLLDAERARIPGGWDDETRPGDSKSGRDTRDDPPDADPEWRDSDGKIEAREVREVAQASGDIESELAGDFDEIPFARLLHRIASSRATGALVCMHPPQSGRATTEGAEPTKIVYFRAGVPVHARSNLVDECLGQVLVRQRRIGPATLRESVSAMQRGEGLQGEVLVSMGAIGPLELSEALAAQLRLKLFELFGWEKGTFRFNADRLAPPELLDIGLGLAEIAVHGVREGMQPARVIERLLPHRERYVIPNPRELMRFVRLPVGASMRGVMRAIDGAHRVRELLERYGEPLQAAQLLYAMWCLDAVRFESEPLARAASFDLPRTADAPPPIEEPPPLIAPEPPLETPEDVRPSDAKEREETSAPRAPSDGSGLRLKREERENNNEISKVIDERVDKLLAAERHFRRGQRALDRAKYDEALRAFEKARELCPDEGQFLAYAAWAKFAAQSEDAFVLSEALELAERGSARAPDFAIGHLLRGRLLLAAGRTTDAHAAFRRSLELDPALDEARSAISRST